MPELDVLQVVIQGGAVGLLGAGFFFGYKFLCKCLEFVADLVGNHLTDLSEKIDRHTEVVDRLLDALLKKE